MKLKMKRVKDCWNDDNNGDPFVKCKVIFQNEVNGNFIEGTLEEKESKIIEQQAFFRSGIKECTKGNKDCFYYKISDGSHEYVEPCGMFGDKDCRTSFLDQFRDFENPDSDGMVRLKKKKST